MVYSHSAEPPVLAVPVLVLALDRPHSVVAVAAGPVSAVQHLSPGPAAVAVVLEPAAEVVVCSQSMNCDDADWPAEWWSGFEDPD